jgi:hypothetical protein
MGACNSGCFRVSQEGVHQFAALYGDGGAGRVGAPDSSTQTVGTSFIQQDPSMNNGLAPDEGVSLLNMIAIFLLLCMVMEYVSRRVTGKSLVQRVANKIFPGVAEKAKNDDLEITSIRA